MIYDWCRDDAPRRSSSELNSQQRSNQGTPPNQMRRDGDDNSECNNYKSDDVDGRHAIVTKRHDDDADGHTRVNLTVTKTKTAVLATRR